MPVEAVTQNGILTLYNVAPEDTGHYRCSGTILQTGETAHDDASLNVAAGGKKNVVICFFLPFVNNGGRFGFSALRSSNR